MITAHKEYLIIIPVLNEGKKICTQLEKLRSYRDRVDIVIVDGGSDDQCYNDQFCTQYGVSDVLHIHGLPGVGKQLGLGMVHALQHDYQGAITMDGNNKDDPAGIPGFIDALQQGYDIVQGSRFLPGGIERHTPLFRKFAITCVHAPLINMRYRCSLTDTTNGFRAYSRSFLSAACSYFSHPSLSQYELQTFLLGVALDHGFRVKEIPVGRVYPSSGPTPTKISFFRGNYNMFRALLGTICGMWKKYDGSVS